MAAQGHHMLAVVEPLQPPELLEWFARQREAIGLEVVPIGPDVSRIVLRALRDNRIVCLLSDRDLTGDGVEVEFFGERTTLPAGPATLALRTGAALLPVAVYFESGPRAPRGRAPAAARPSVRAGCATTSPASRSALAVRVRRAHPGRAGAVASAPAELAERPRVGKPAHL